MADAAMCDFDLHLVLRQITRIKFKWLQRSFGGFRCVRINCWHKCFGGNQSIEAAANSMTFATSDGLEMKLTWLALISLVLAPIRLAMNLSKSGLMELSWVETTYQ